ncbi:hypothetical protein LEP1GSC202_3445 [Leptospira yanagawae serovar Saopaulo str. Sao Paulo = ATCC 700523]|uniref:Uncharacterized protein n=1 Tax=Leptospira yanagawae serovar Saopaulo str. Sao Paulo = ATCC 700523 TaxID=1249483 RepID=A0A5E8HBU5_9LEPT|nr:hypothetical protein [Leptospira yanagawae]EOQ88322.1 hypothetical protein LEP1GSC202_3445 [Leptospira yanagawae serovar Saopaulo str. Sao Paulo = ATCC 700523]
MVSDPFFLLFVFSVFLSAPLHSQWFGKETSFETIWNEFQKEPSLHSIAFKKETYPILREIETKQEEEFQYYQNLCKSNEIRDLSDILKQISFYDALLHIRRCAEGKKEDLLPIEKDSKKRIFDLILFPKLEILPNEITNDEIYSLVRELLREWEKTVYLFSNFYKPHEVLFLGKEREYSLTMNRILYSEMPESKRKTLLLRLLQDIKSHQKSTYQLFYYSNQNPWNLKTLKLENEKSKSIFLEILKLWKLDPIFSNTQRSQLNDLEICLAKIPSDQTKIRIFGFFGFFHDYGRFGYENQIGALGSNQTRLQYIHQTLFQSHHFQKRLENVMISCKNSVESQKEL